MRLSCKIDDGIDPITLEKLRNQLGVTNVTLKEDVTRVGFNLPEILEITGVRELIQIHDPIARILPVYVKHEIASDKSGATCHKIRHERVVRECEIFKTINSVHPKWRFGVVFVPDFVNRLLSHFPPIETVREVDRPSGIRTYVPICVNYTRWYYD
jgi:hypothetical protein